MTTADPKAAAPIPRPLTGQNALVTGASSGIGRAVAIALGQAGADVVVNYAAADDRALEVVRTIEQHGVKAYAHRADVSDESQVRDMFSTMVQRLGTIDILVNNTGLQRDAPFQEMTLAQWNMVISAAERRHPPILPL
jgi:glucose 1-dehydrogenase